VHHRDSRVNYFFKSFTDYIFKRSPVTYFIGLILSLAGVAISGDLTIDASTDSIRLAYGNDLTYIPLAFVCLCCFLAYKALKLQMNERYTKLMHEQESLMLEKQEKLKRETDKEIEKLKADLELEKRKAINSHENLGKASNTLLKKIVRLEEVFPIYVGRGSVNPIEIDGKRSDIYIADAINEQHKFRKLYIEDENLLESWNKMLLYLDESQRAITRSINGEKLDTTPLSTAFLYIAEYMKQISDSGHTVATEI